MSKICCHDIFLFGDIDDIGDIAILATFAMSFFYPLNPSNPYSHQLFERVNYGVPDATCKVVVDGESN